jgi:hypothetical protein
VVDRATFVALMKEQKLDLSGAIRPEDAQTVGQMSGAAYFVVRVQQPLRAEEPAAFGEGKTREYDQFIQQSLDPANIPRPHEDVENGLHSIVGVAKADGFGSLRLLSVAEGRVLGATTCRSSDLAEEIDGLIFP